MLPRLHLSSRLRSASIRPRLVTLWLCIIALTTLTSLSFSLQTSSFSSIQHFASRISTTRWTSGRLDLSWGGWRATTEELPRLVGAEELVGYLESRYGGYQGHPHNRHGPQENLQDDVIATSPPSFASHASSISSAPAHLPVLDPHDDILRPLAGIPKFILTLPHRTDRQRDMAYLIKQLWGHTDQDQEGGLGNTTFVAATNADAEVVGRLMQEVVRVRHNKSTSPVTGVDGEESRFAWLPTDSLGTHSASSPFWDLLEDNSSSSNSTNATTVTTSSTTSLPLLTCATQNDTIPPYNASLHDWQILTPQKIAVWYSHVKIWWALFKLYSPFSRSSQFAQIQGLDTGTQHEDKESKDEIAAIIFEDDVDAESDLDYELNELWEVVPPRWDVVFLGHCWSNESTHPNLPFPQISSSSSSKLPFNTAQSTVHAHYLHPSYAPLCTHAYILSIPSLPTLLAHLTYHPSFAYSRALDQAIRWLVMEGRLRAFSVVPSLVVQRKVGGSDVFLEGDGAKWKGRGKGSKWREGLMHGVFVTTV